MKVTSLDELVELWGIARGAAKTRLSRMVSDGRAERVGRGVYRLIEPKPTPAASPEIEAMIAAWRARLDPILEALADFDEVIAPIRRAAKLAGAVLDAHRSRAAAVVAVVRDAVIEDEHEEVSGPC